MGNGTLTLTDLRSFSGLLLNRRISNYRLDGEDTGSLASADGCMRFQPCKLNPSLVDFNLSIDNLTDKHYFETQNFFGSGKG